MAVLNWNKWIKALFPSFLISALFGSVHMDTTLERACRVSGAFAKSVGSRRSTRAMKYSNQATLVWGAEGKGGKE